MGGCPNWVSSAVSGRGVGRASASVHVLEGGDWYTRILLLYKDPAIIQGSYYYTRILLLYKDPTIIHKSYDNVVLVIWSQEEDWDVLAS